MGVISKSLDYVGEVVEYVFNFIVGETGVERESYFVVVLLEGVGIILYIVPERFVSGHHRERFVMDVGGNATLSHLHDDVVALLHGDTGDAREVEVTA